MFDTKGNITRYYRTGFPMTSPVTIYYDHDAAGNVTGMSYPSGRFVGFQRDSLGRITNIVTYQTPTSTVGQTIASSIAYTPYGGVQSLTFGNSLVETFTTDTDNRIIAVKVQPPGGAAATIDRALTWMGNSVTAITDAQSSSLSQTFAYTPTNRLASATGWYGAYTWTYDAVGNRTSEQLGSVLSTYAYPTTSNRLASITSGTGTPRAFTYDAVGNRTSEQLGSALSTYAYPTTSNRLTSITPGTGTPRAFTYDAAGDILTDTRTGALGLTYQYDEEGRLAKAYQTNSSANGGAYAYDARSRLVSRTATQSTAPTSTTTLYLYDLSDHIIAELNASGQTLKEYVWLNDMPVAVIDGVNTGTTSVYFVHVDHLMRPILMTDQSQTWVWYAVYKPFGETTTLYTNPEVMNGRFPGQWFQLETGLAYNWHRHYDPTIGRYVQPDPLGLTALLRDGSSVYGYVESNPLGLIDRLGLSALIPPTVPPNIPGGPYSPAGSGQQPGTFFGPPNAKGPRNICRWVPSDSEGGPPGSGGYWKTQIPGQKGWSRFDQGGNPISPEEAHPGPRPLPQDEIIRNPEVPETYIDPDLIEPFPP